MKFKALLPFSLLVLLMTWVVSPLTTHAAVDLIYFTGHGRDGFNELEWETATELDNVGFYILRSSTQTGNYVRVSLFIPTGPDSLAGYHYGYVDSNVVNGTGYWYQLESIDSSTQSAFHGPILVIAGVYATETTTPTATSPGQAGSAATSTKTATVKPTSTRTPTRTTVSSFFQSNSTNSFFATATSAALNANQLASTQSLQSTQSGFALTETVTATATLIPLPEITMEFPVAMADPATLNKQASAGEQEAGSGGPGRVWFTLERLIFIGFIILVWVLLGGWFYLSYRRIEK